MGDAIFECRVLEISSLCLFATLLVPVLAFLSSPDPASSASGRRGVQARQTPISPDMHAAPSVAAGATAPRLRPLGALRSGKACPARDNIGPPGGPAVPARHGLGESRSACLRLLRWWWQKSAISSDEQPRNVVESSTKGQRACQICLSPAACRVGTRRLLDRASGSEERLSLCLSGRLAAA